MIHRLSAPTTVNIVLNRDCNHKCSHCYNPWRENIISEGCIVSDYRNRLDTISNELKKANVFSAILTGGEPLLHPDYLFYCIEKLNSCDISMSLNTNLTLMSDELANQLVFNYGWQNMILTSIPSVVSSRCDSITRTKGSFTRIVNGINICQSHGIKVGINIVLTKYNLEDLDLLEEFIKSYPIDYVSISSVIPPLYDLENPNYYLSNDDIIHMVDTLLYLKSNCGVDVGSVTPIPLCIVKDVGKYYSILDTTCTAGLNVCTIDLTSGDVYACAHEDGSYGNIYSDGLMACWNKMEMWSTTANINKQCVSCDWLSLCGGECRMMNRADSTLKYKISNANEFAAVGRDPNEQQLLSVHKDRKFRVNITHSRKEKMGVVVKSDYIESVISEELYSLCCKLQRKEPFSVSDLFDYVNENDSAYKVICILIYRHIIVSV